MTFPRTCRGRSGPHVLNGPEDLESNGHGLTCRECRRQSMAAAQARYRDSWDYFRAMDEYQKQVNRRRDAADATDLALLEDLRNGG
jgi:hypothetical protein